QPAGLHLDADLDDLANVLRQLIGDATFAGPALVDSCRRQVFANDQVAVLGKVLEQRGDLLPPFEHVRPAPRLGPIEPAIGAAFAARHAQPVKIVQPTAVAADHGDLAAL